ncbi:hypothetical protein PACTADRAFT_33008 [Pachysolen tannophilus NRRL Y-2460]|uniref:Uncharacterized protein n=1 Tax=Pachysolen tannophilus NRRL Y-2460 TaxID=669874 RepID=A0A1E4TVN4_PACTA|nr:hypothetical protein PACTADRAFT_33008 [Pachysolen tannophilus NRRL Y-2460]
MSSLADSSEATSQEDVYLQFYRYDFENFPEYQQGLQQVFADYLIQYNSNLQPGQKELSEISEIESSTKNQLTLQAKVYFFCEKTNEILNLEDYFDWKKNFESKIEEVTDHNIETDAPYSSNYEKIVDLILNNKPVPGIKKIPEVILDEATASKHELKERKKPWEKENKV